MSEETAITVPSEVLAVTKPENAQHLMRYATDVASVCKEIVLKSACNIQGKKYIKCEGWMSIATAHGCIASSRDVKRVDGGWTAIGEIRRMSDGVVLSTAEGFVGTDEKRWGNADEYACRAMAQTRAISRACRAAFAHIVVLMDAGLSTTPMEEVPESGFSRPEAPKTTPAQQNAPTGNPGAKEQPSGEPPWKAAFTFSDYRVQTGKTKAGKPWRLFICSFEDNDGKSFQCSTFSESIGGNLDVLKGQDVRITWQPGRKQGTLELVSIEPDTAAGDFPPRSEPEQADESDQIPF